MHWVAHVGPIAEALLSIAKLCLQRLLPIPILLQTPPAAHDNPALQPSSQYHPLPSPTPSFPNSHLPQPPPPPTLPYPKHSFPNSLLHSSDPRVAKVAFTGSGPTGRRVALAAAENLRPASMELGGKSALIVFGDADVEKAVEWAMVRGPCKPGVAGEWEAGDTQQGSARGTVAFAGWV